MQKGPQQAPQKDGRVLPMSAPPKAHVSPDPLPLEKERCARDRPAAPPKTAPRTAKGQAPRRGRAKPSLVQYVRSPDSKEHPRRRRGDSPGTSRCRWCSRSTSRRVQPRREDSRSSRSCHARRRSRRNSRSPSCRRRRSRSRRSRRPKEAPQGRRTWPSEDKQGLQESRRWAGRDHAQEASRLGKASFQD